MLCGLSENPGGVYTPQQRQIAQLARLIAADHLEILANG
jgi:hypothetical protein